MWILLYLINLISLGCIRVWQRILLGPQMLVAMLYHLEVSRYSAHEYE